MVCSSLKLYLPDKPSHFGFYFAEYGAEYGYLSLIITIFCNGVKEKIMEAGRKDFQQKGIGAASYDSVD